MSKLYRLSSTHYLKPLNGPERLFARGEEVEVADDVFPGPGMWLIGERGADGVMRKVTDPDANRPQHVRRWQFGPGAE